MLSLQKVCQWKIMNESAEMMIDATKDQIRLNKYVKLVHFIANDYHELSYEKAQWQRDDWKKRCKKLIEEDNK